MKQATTMNLQTAMESFEKLSLRKLAEATGCNYNMLLKASKLPVEGVPYDPTATNYEAIERYLLKKNPDGLDYAEIAELDLNTAVKLPFTVEPGMLINIRGDEAAYRVEMVTPTHVVIMAVDGTQPRVFSNSTFMHQGPKALKAE